MALDYPSFVNEVHGAAEPPAHGMMSFYLRKAQAGKTVPINQQEFLWDQAMIAVREIVHALNSSHEFQTYIQSKLKAGKQRDVVSGTCTIKESDPTFQQGRFCYSGKATTVFFGRKDSSEKIYHPPRGLGSSSWDDGPTAHAALIISFAKPDSDAIVMEAWGPSKWASAQHEYGKWLRIFPDTAFPIFAERNHAPTQNLSIGKKIDNKQLRGIDFENAELENEITATCVRFLFSSLQHMMGKANFNRIVGGIFKPACSGTQPTPPA